MVKVGPHRRPVRQAPLVAHRAGRRRRAAGVPRPHRQRRRASPPPPASPTPSASLRAYHQSASTLNLLRAFTKGGFADLGQVHTWNQEFVASSPEGRRYERVADEIDRALRFMRACGIDTDTQPGAPRGRLLHQPRGAHPRLRGGAHPPGLAHRRLVRLLGPHALDRRAHPPARRRPRRVPPRRRATRSAARSGPTATARRGRSRSASALNPDRIPGRLTLITRMGAGNGRGRSCRRCCARCATPATRWCGRATRCTATPSPHRAAARPGTSTTSSPRSPASSPPTAPRAPGPAACTSSSPATTSPSASAAPRRSSTTTSTSRYETMCDPRLNGRQSLDLAFQVGRAPAELSRRRRGPGGLCRVTYAT